MRDNDKPGNNETDCLNVDPMVFVQIFCNATLTEKAYNFALDILLKGGKCGICFFTHQPAEM